VDKNLDASEAYLVRKAPATIVARHGEQDSRIRFTGVPKVYEFIAPEDVFMDVSRNEASLTTVSLLRIANV